MPTTLNAIRFQRLWQRLGSQGDNSMLFAQLLAAYLQPHRAYHTLAHIEDCLHQFDQVRDEADQPDEVEVALWFHDAVYAPQAGDNEAQSCIWATQALQKIGVSPAAIDRVATMILATKHDRVPETHDCKLLLDTDLSILGQEPDQFAAYERCIRTEYCWVAEEQYRAGRVAVLQGFLNRPAIFYTSLFRNPLEAQARHNLERSIAQLTEG